MVSSRIKGARSSRVWVWFLGVLTAVSSSTWRPPDGAAHPPDATGRHAPHVDHAPRSRKVQRATVVPVAEKDATTAGATPADCVAPEPAPVPTPDAAARPWSNKPVLDQAARFHFAVMTDNTGGHRPGVWMHGVRSVNLLRPSFVVSVGDLIEGYSEDEAEIEAQWKEFLGFIEQMEMRFYFVAGNHDLSNPKMHENWRRHFGPEWYSFDFKDVHFVCLSSEDPESTIGEEQLAWVKEDLARHQEARWTFVFLHKPLWVYAEDEIAAGNPDRTHWKQVEAALGTRPHTVFAGHTHHYLQFERNGQNYYQLATTGGGSQLRGNDYGEFDHVTWVTMEPDGPRIANIRLDGVLPADIVTEKSSRRFRQFLEQTRVDLAPIMIETENELQAGEIMVYVRNDFDHPVTVSGQVQGMPLRGLYLEPDHFEVELSPSARQKIACRFQFTQAMDLTQLRHVTLQTKMRSHDERPWIAELTLPVTIDRQYTCPRLAIQVDGDLKDWVGTELAFTNPPPRFGASQQWQGPEDGSLRFRIAHDDRFLYIGATVQDDAVLPERDRLRFEFDARPLADRLASPQLGNGTHTMTLEPSRSADQSKLTVTRRGEQPTDIPGVKLAVAATPGGYTCEWAVPIESLMTAQGATWEGFQLNAVMLDIDQKEDADLFLLWRPAEDVDQSNQRYGFFARPK